MSEQYRLQSLNIGRPVLLQGHSKEVMSGFGKVPTEERIYLSAVNLEGDGQGDTVNHGGVDKAVCVYCYEHYPYWEKRLNRKFPPGAFGENVTLEGLTEEDVRIGDIFEWGEAVVQVSQPRQPCYKIGVYHQLPEFTAYVEQTGYTGFYFRVLKPGFVSKRDGLTRLEKDSLGVSIAYANQVKYRNKSDLNGIRKVLEVPALSDSWRATFNKRLAKLAEGQADQNR
ncbi:MOSC domain-containing protein [Paenibacillus pinistramenti]|uniref:MOSC domain-containing protein n=1 Tax=Paenibacillus pinistramenti TaxID=1768003 RepID=UPI001108D4B0|nr:MOSC domain-containing protein [Paenibacillus pinistramenti]